MFEISGNKISLTRGDSAVINVTVYDQYGIEYELQEGDVIEFSVKRYPVAEKSEPIIHKVGLPFKIEPDDTKNLLFMEYAYDVQITLASGDVFTIIPPSVFRILSEVTSHE